MSDCLADSSEIHAGRGSKIEERFLCKMKTKWEFSFWKAISISVKDCKFSN